MPAALGVVILLPQLVLRLGQLAFQGLPLRLVGLPVKPGLQIFLFLLQLPGLPVHRVGVSGTLLLLLRAGLFFRTCIHKKISLW